MLNLFQYLRVFLFWTGEDSNHPLSKEFIN